jgi:hypothetical protein
LRSSFSIANAIRNEVLFDLSSIAAILLLLLLLDIDGKHTTEKGAKIDPSYSFQC